MLFPHLLSRAKKNSQLLISAASLRFIICFIRLSSFNLVTFVPKVHIYTYRGHLCGTQSNHFILFYYMWEIAGGNH